MTHFHNRIKGGHKIHQLRGDLAETNEAWPKARHLHSLTTLPLPFDFLLCHRRQPAAFNKPWKPIENHRTVAQHFYFALDIFYEMIRYDSSCAKSLTFYEKSVSFVSWVVISCFHLQAIKSDVKSWWQDRVSLSVFCLFIVNLPLPSFPAFSQLESALRVPIVILITCTMWHHLLASSA